MSSYKKGSPALDANKENHLTKPKFLQSVDNAKDIETTDHSDAPIFNKRKIQLRIPAQYKGNFIHLTVEKNWLVCIMQAPMTSASASTSVSQVTLLRFFLPRAIPPGEISLDKYLLGYKVSNLFLDYTGHHTLISLTSETSTSYDFLYIHDNGLKVRRIDKFKDHEITSIAFNREFGTEATTGPILLGTHKGVIYETEFSLDADKPLYKKQVYDLGLGRSKYPITGLKYIHIPNSNKSVVIATVPDNIFTFQEILRSEEKSLQAIFTNYVNGTQTPTCEAVKTDLNYSVLRLYSHPNEKLVTSWAWLCGAGVRYGQVSENTSSITEEFLLGDHLLPMEKDLENRKPLSYDERRSSVPLSFVLTEYHVLLMYIDRIIGICLLNHQVIFEDFFPDQMGKLLNVVRDNFTGHIYVYTEKMLFNYKINDEHRNIWRIYLNKEQYDMAELHADNNQQNINTILESKAEAAFNEKNYQIAAEVYAKTNKAFEEICLKLIDLEDKRPLITYIRKCLDKLPNSGTDEHILIMTTWLIDLYLSQINYPGCIATEKAQWQNEYDEFMRLFVVVKCIRSNYNAIQTLISQHGDAHNLGQFAIANEDYEEVIVQHITDEKYLDALHVLSKQKNVELYYKYCPLIMEYLPKETVDVLINQGRKLHVEKLIPTLININTSLHITEIIKYLEYCIYNLGEINMTVHNYLIRLYAEHQPLTLSKYLENEGNDLTLIHYDPNVALNLCFQYDVKIASIYIYCLLEMWYDAVNMALKYDIKLAKETASKPKDDDIKRELWLRIAYHEIIGTNDVKKALDLLNECDLLNIEDLLPFFSDFEKIDDFKEPICKALKEYNQKIQDLQHDMEECLKQSERVTNDLQNVRERCLRIEANELCNICDNYVLIKPFFVFGCGHKFHTDCLEKAVIPLLSNEKSRKLTMIKQQLDALQTHQTITQQQHSVNVSSHKDIQKKREQLKSEFEEILAANCLLCGLMIETIDQPFVEDWDQVNVDWE